MKQEDIVYAGEQLIWGNIGNWAIAFAFITAFIAFFSYAFSVKNSIKGMVDWKWLGRISFILHGISVFTIIGILFYILIDHKFEYQYAWQHSNKTLPFKYIFAAFWEGQEGSFLLWTFWCVIISFILMFTSKEWEGRVMTIFALVQMFLITMVMGIVVDIPKEDLTIFGLQLFEQPIKGKIGNTPFLLLRETPMGMQMPLFYNYEMIDGIKVNSYLTKIDGRGLNPALQNYWMTIHPPTLFLGFALTLVPYLFAVAGLWSGKLQEWTRPALPWTFIGIGVLGGGVLMGGAWAYEALNFGGFWAWDPVENSSLVPWLTLVAAGHLMLVPRNKGVNLAVAIVLALLSFLLVLYSTFLTRSGVLGDASVHSFTDLGMTGQLLVYLFFFMLLPPVIGLRKARYQQIWMVALAGFVAITYFFDLKLIYAVLIFSFFTWIYGIVFAKNDQVYFPKKQDDSIYSREFWIFVGALVIVASAVHLTAVTSIPVINKLFNTKRAPVNIDHYNQVQTFFALAICALIAVVQFMRYKQDKRGKFWNNILRSLIVSVVIVIIGLLVFDEFKKPEYILVILTSLFAVLANIDYIIRFVKKNWKLSGPSIAHVGFAMVILGAVISAGHKKIISANNNGINLEMLNSEFKNNENIMLHLHDTVEMGPYYLTFVNDTLLNNIAWYQIDYLKKENGNFKKAFTLFPKLITGSANMGNVPEPSTKHYLLKDIFTHVTYVDMDRIERLKNPGKANLQKEKEIQHFKLEKGDTIFGTRYYIIFEGLEAASDISHVDESQPLNLTLRGSFVVKDMKGDADTIHPIYDIKNNVVSTRKDMSEKFGIELELERILEKHVEINMREVRMENNRFIIMQAIIFPGINILWVGCFLMVIGTFFAVIRRITQLRKHGRD